MAYGPERGSATRRNIRSPNGSAPGQETLVNPRWPFRYAFVHIHPPNLSPKTKTSYPPVPSIPSIPLFLLKSDFWTPNRGARAQYLGDKRAGMTTSPVSARCLNLAFSNHYWRNGINSRCRNSDEFVFVGSIAVTSLWSLMI
jgi:hypothetical protein